MAAYVLLANPYPKQEQKARHIFKTCNAKKLESTGMEAGNAAKKTLPCRFSMLTI